jgi:lipid-binding SYLF domain-containing protein
MRLCTNRWTFSNFTLIACVPKFSSIGTINAEVTGRTTQIEVNADGTKTMLTGGTKTVYSWDTDKGSAGYFSVDGAIAAVIQSFCD